MEETPTRPATARPRRSGGRRLAPLAVALTVATIAVFGATQAGGGPTPDPDPGPTPTPTTAPTSPQQALLAHVPPDIRPSCQSDPGAPAGTRAALMCTTAGADELHYYDFGTAAAMERHYNAQVAGSGAAPGFGDCRPGALPAEDGDSGGRTLCHEEPEGASIEWTRPALGIYAIAHVTGPFDDRLVEAWQAAGPV